MTRARWVLLKPERAYPRGNESLQSTALDWRIVIRGCRGLRRVRIGGTADR